MYEHHKQPILPAHQFALRLMRHLLAAIMLVAASLLVGILGYRYLAGLGWVDAFLNASMLLGGMGPVDVLPNRAAKIFAGGYALYAGLVFIVSAGIIIAPVGHRILHGLHVDEAD